MNRYRRPTQSLVPRYRQISDELSRRIAAREFDPAVPMPTERELCEAFGVSRITVRKALDELVSRNLVVRRQGLGTFVSEDKLGRWSVTLRGILEDVLLPYHLVVTRELRAVPPRHVLDFAETAEEVPHKLIEGVNYTADGRPIVRVEYYFPPAIGERLSTWDLQDAPGAIVAAQRASGRRVEHANQIVEAIVADGDLARGLELASGTPVLRITRAFYDAAREVLQLYRGAYHPTHYRYTAALYPRAAAP